MSTQKSKPDAVLVVDATNATLGRLASFAAKQSLLGKTIVIINCNDAIVAGNKQMVIEQYKKAKVRGGGWARKGPHFPSTPERLMKRTIRGMLSFRQGRGLAAFKRIMSYNACPEEFENMPRITAGKEKNTTSMSLKVLCTEL
jgi:large subunit ribosomal protein L13